jgi:hypothetical protein
MSLISLVGMFAWAYYAISKTLDAKDDLLTKKSERVHALEVELDQLRKEMSLMTETHTMGAETCDGFMQAMGFTYREVKREVPLLKDPRIARVSLAIRKNNLFEMPYDPTPRELDQLSADVVTLARHREFFEAIERNLSPSLRTEWGKISDIACDVASRISASAESADWTLSDPTPD